ncbi:unnamed protein product [Phaeothamnion confervicola]
MSSAPATSAPAPAPEGSGAASRCHLEEIGGHEQQVVQNPFTLRQGGGGGAARGLQAIQERGPPPASQSLAHYGPQARFLVPSSPSRPLSAPSTADMYNREAAFGHVGLDVHVENQDTDSNIFDPDIVDRQWPDGAEAVAAIKVWGLGNTPPRQITVTKPGGHNKRMECTGPTCPVFLTLGCGKKNSETSSTMWRVRSYCLGHVNCTSVAAPSIKQLQMLQAPVTATLSDFAVSSKTMVNSLYGTTGLKITNRQALRARSAITKANEGGYAEGFMDMKGWLEEVADANPTSHTAFKVNSAGRFDAALIVLPRAAEVRFSL